MQFRYDGPVIAGAFRYDAAYESAALSGDNCVQVNLASGGAIAVAVGGGTALAGPACIQINYASGGAIAEVGITVRAALTSRRRRRLHCAEVA